MEQPSDKTSQEQARESLIAISYTSPEEEETRPLRADVKPVINNTITNGGGVPKGNNESSDADKLRSELISISYDESPTPNVAVSPVALPNGFSHG